MQHKDTGLSLKPFKALIVYIIKPIRLPFELKEKV